jgi:hypothetical protein
LAPPGATGANLRLGQPDGGTANDTTYFVPLVEETAEHFEIREVSADKAYLSRKNLSAVGALGGM